MYPYLQYRNTHLRDAISVKNHVTITLWTLGSPAEYRTVAHLFGVGQCTVCEVVHETCQATVNHLPKYIHFPSVAQQQQYIPYSAIMRRSKILVNRLISRD